MINSVGKSDGEYVNNLKVVSKDKVVLKAREANKEMIKGGIYIPSEVDINNRLHKYEIADIAPNAAEVTGLKLGDIILADMLARYYDTFPISVIKYDNIICKCKDYDSTDILPLNNQVLVEFDKTKEDEQKGIVVLTDLLPVGTIIDINENNLKNKDLKVGDKVLCTKASIVFYYEGKKILIYNSEDIVATLV